MRFGKPFLPKRGLRRCVWKWHWLFSRWQPWPVLWHSAGISQRRAIKRRAACELLTRAFNHLFSVLLWRAQRCHGKVREDFRPAISWASRKKGLCASIPLQCPNPLIKHPWRVQLPDFNVKYFLPLLVFFACLAQLLKTPYVNSLETLQLVKNMSSPV